MSSVRAVMEGRRFRRGAALGILGAIALAAMVPGVVVAHPLGNFTINHFAGIRVTPTTITLDVVIDEAEIPTVSARQQIDANGDGVVSAAEIEAERQAACGRLSSALGLAVDGLRADLTVDAAGLTFPAGAAGLPTMRLVCEYAAVLPTPLAAGSAIRFSDTSNADRIGWREIVVTGSGVSISGAPAAAESASDRLTQYPQSLLKAPLSMAAVSFAVSPGGPLHPAPCIADAFVLTAPVSLGAEGLGCTQNGRGSGPALGSAALAAAVPGGVGSDLPSLLSSSDMTLPALLLTILTAMALGAGHALTPGHGKTLMAAYLVGTRGTARHALALGLTVTISHTVGVLLLALVIVALRVVTPDSYNHVLGVVAGVMVVGIGGWLVVSQTIPAVRRTLAARRRRAEAEAHDHGDHLDDLRHGHAHDHGSTHEHGAAHEHDHGARDHAITHDHEPGAHDHGHGARDHAGTPDREPGAHDYDHGHEPGAHDNGHVHEHHDAQDHPHADPLVVVADTQSADWHSHGGVRHRHTPAAGSKLTWRSLFALGLFGGLVPSINALIILLASLATGRPLYGLVLVIAFGVGMAVVLGGVGLGLVYASRWMEGSTRAPVLGRLVAWAPAFASVAILAVGLYLTSQALAGTPNL